MPSDNQSTKVSVELQKDLAAYGLLRSKVMEKAAPNANSPKFFGLRDGYRDTELKFDTDIKAIQDANMTVSLAAPELETFDMLVTTDFKKAVSIGSTDKLRSFLRKIVDRA